MLNFPVWHKNGTREAFLMHVTAVLNAIKKRGLFNNYKKAEKDYKEAKKAVEQPGLLYSCLTVLEQRQEGLARKRPRKPRRTPLRRLHTPSQMPRKPRMLLTGMMIP
jgi:hypothetical protein